MEQTRSGQEQSGRPTIGFLTTHTGADALCANVWLGMVQAAQKQGMPLICFVGGELRSQRSFQDQANVLYDLAKSDKLAGLVLWGSVLRNFIGAEDFNAFCDQFQPLPLVELDGRPKAVTESYGYRGMRLVITHLIEAHGHRRIAFIPGTEGHREAQARYQAYRDVLRTYKLPFDPNLVAPPDFWDESSGRRAVQILLTHRQLRFEALAAANDRLAIGAIEALREHAIRVPDDVAVVGFDNNPDGQYISPPLTTIPYPTNIMGARALRILLAKIKGEPIADHIFIPANLVIRQSCGCADPMVVQAAAGYLPKPEAPLETTLVTLRQALRAELAHIFEELSWQRWAEQLAEALLLEIAGKAPHVFLATLHDVLRQVTAGGGDVAPWQNVISRLRRQTLHVLRAAEPLARAEDLFGQARVLLGEVARRNQGQQMLQAEQQAQLLRKISAKLISTFDVPELMQVLAQELPRLDIPGCYLALYEQPEAPTAWARLMLAYNAQGRIALEPEGRRFPARDLLPAGFWPQTKWSALVMEALYFQQKQLGFVLFEVGPHDGRIYGILRELISSALQGALLVQQVRQRSLELAQANAELAREKHVLETFMATVPDRIYFKDCEGRITRANAAHAAAMGLTETAREIGKTDFDFFPSAQAQVKYDQEQQILRTGQPLFAIEEPDGPGKWILTTKMPLRDEHGTIIGTFGISRNITELKEAQVSLEHAYQEILRRNEQLTQENWQYYLQASLLRAPVDVSPDSRTLTEQKTLEGTYWCVTFLKFVVAPGAKQTGPPSTRALVTELKRCYEQGIAALPVSSTYLQLTDTEAVMILNFKDRSPVQTLCALLLSQSQAMVQADIATLVIGIGETVTTPAELHRSYESAQQALLRRPNLPAPQILSPPEREPEEHDALMVFFPVTAERQLINAVVAGERGKVKMCLASILAQNHLEQSTYQKLLTLHDHCLRTVSKILAQFPISDMKPREGRTFRMFRAAKPETLPEFYSRVTEIFQELTECYRQQQKQQAEALIQKLRRHLEQHYADFTLSLTSIAEAFRLTPTYISEYFKARTGVNYVEYLAALRLAKAKELLLAHPTWTLRQIAPQVGFPNPETLIRTFKRFEGLTPGKYRKQAASK